MAAIDWTDPCARFAALNTAYYNLLSGNQEYEIHTRTNDAEERVKFSAANIEILKAERDAAQRECLLATGQTPPSRRAALRLGPGRRRFGPFGGC